MKKVHYLIILSFISFNHLFSQSTYNGSFGKGITIMASDSSFKMKISTRFQTLAVCGAPFADDEVLLNNAKTNIMIRRARLKFDGFAYSPKLQYKVELGLSNRDIGGSTPATNNAPRIILDAVLKWNFAGNFSLWAGQTKLPGNRERVISSQKLQFVDRSLLNSRYNIDRDIGLQVHHFFKTGNSVWKQAFSVSMGEGRNITQNNTGGFDYTGRLEYLPFGEFSSKGDYFGSDLKRESKPKLSIGVTYDYNDGASRERGQLGSFLNGETNLSTLFADLMFKYKGISIMAEYADKKADNPIVLDEEGIATGAFYVGKGLNIQTGYLFKNNWELAGRYTYINPEKISNRNDMVQYTIGVSKYISGHNLKVQSDISYTHETYKTLDDLMYRMQVELSF